MKNLIRMTATGCLAVAMIVQFSCSGDASIVPDAQDSLLLMKKEMKEQMISEEVSEAINNQVIEEILDEVLIDLEAFDFLKSASVCPVVTVERPDSARFPRIITRDFGEGCVNKWGVEKSGKVIVTLYGRWLEKGAKRIVTFDNYTHRGISVEGEKKILCLGLNEDSLYVHVIKGDIKLVKADTLVIKREIHKKRTMLTGWGNPDVPKEWLIGGYVKVSKSNGMNYLMQIKEPLYRIQGCRWTQSGIKVLHFNAWNDDGDKDTGDKDTGDKDTGDKDYGDKDEYKHKLTIDYSYSESEDSCDSYALRWVDDEEAEVINMKR